MQILHAYKVYRPEVEGGIPEVIANLTTAEPSGQSSSILVARMRGFPHNFVVDGIPVAASGSLGTVMSMPIAPFYPLSLLRQSFRSDVVVHHSPFPLTDLAIAGLRARTALIVHWHADILGRDGLKAALMPFIRRSLARADRIIVSHPAMIDVSESLQLVREKCVAIPYGADLEFWSELSFENQAAAADLRRRFPRLILSIGRLVPYKGYPVLLHALKGMNAHLIIVGDGPLLASLKNLARELGVADRVTFAGRLPRDRIKELLHAARMLTLASVSSAEAFGLVQIEAMAAGCPVVNTDLPTAVPFIARHELEGLTVAQGDADQLRAAMGRLLDDEGLAEALGRAARVRARQEFGINTFRERNFTVYREAIAYRNELSRK